MLEHLGRAGQCPAGLVKGEWASWAGPFPRDRDEGDGGHSGRLLDGGLGWGRGHLNAGDVCGDFSRWGARGPVGFVFRRQECTPPRDMPRHRDGEGWVVPHGNIRGPLGAEQADLKVKLEERDASRKSEVWAGLGQGSGLAAVPGP